MAKYLKKADRKRQLKDAAIELIQTKGYRNTSVQDIIDRAKTSKGGFYNCYSSKAELYKEIVEDGCNYRYQQMMEYKNANKHLDKKTLLVEMLLDKIVSYNIYKKSYSKMLTEMGTDKDLFDFYQSNATVARKMFAEFCKNEGFTKCLNLNSQEYEAFINSLIVGVDIFSLYDSEKYRDMLRIMLTAYFEKIGF